MSSFGFPIFVVTALIAGTAAAIVVTPKDLLRSSVVDAPAPRYAAVDTSMPNRSRPVFQPVETRPPAVQLASLTVSVTPLAEPVPVATPVATDIRQITAGVLNMRSKPDKHSELIASLPRGTRVTVSDTSGSWAYVTTSDGTEGWLSQNFLAPAD